MKTAMPLPFLIVAFVRRFRRGAVAPVLAGCALMLAACGGSGSDVSAPPASARPALTGLVTDGSATPVDTVSVKGAAGLTRTARNSFGGNAFSVDLTALTGPFALTAPMTDGQPLVSVALGAGRANLTPFTHLLIARMTAQDPAAWYSALGTTGGPSLADLSASDLATAQSALQRQLRARLGIALPGSGTSLVTDAFELRAGDAMNDAITALSAALASRTITLARLTADIAVEAQRCRAERITLTASDGADEFCPASKSTRRDSADAGVTLMNFITGAGDTLLLRLRGDTVLDLNYTPAGGSAVGCTGTACTGITLGAPAGDLARTVSFSATALGAGSARRTLDGSLAGAAPGIELPPLPCDDNRWYLIAPDLSVIADCTDSASAQTRGLRRQLYTFTNGAAEAPTWVEITVEDGLRVIGVLVYHANFDTGLYVPDYRCLGADCNGATVTAPDAAGLRRIALDDTRLARVLADGSLATTRDTRLRASFGVADAVTDWTPANCSFSTEDLLVRFSDETEPTHLCPVADLGGMALKGSFIDADGNPGYYAQGFVGSGPDNASLAESITVFTAGTAVSQISFARRDGQVLECKGNCAGVTVSAPDAAGMQRVSFVNALLAEVATTGLAGDRSLTVTGSFEVLSPLAPTAARLALPRASRMSARR